ncbi:sulfotransferase [Bosea sp. (in: a-proteobacteria)]|uniref:sulfotransferase n=1 Tax=Bosea sp. (in: a-proteobacteria) TaxID=1871050 RepID=UPI002633FC3E|nr:sulfotransferase [Bosea sp. (in: a-proteobacteria)]MCO5090660.1 sulfotransferase [Bosea sp. (in: a-proteobacteria)]
MTEPDEKAMPQFAGLTSRYGKDMRLEGSLARLNAIVAPVQAALEADCAEPRIPPVFILGPPRSGTTVVSQLLASTGRFGMATNFVARFWQAPALGLMIQDALGLAKDGVESSLSSKRGVTKGWTEPSEFGYFWSRWFDLGQPTHALGEAERRRFDAVGLRRSLAAMEQVAGLPLAMKNNSWFTLNADLLAEAFPGCVLVVCEREPFFVAQSIWLQRLDLFGDASRWWSVRPADHDEIVKLPPLAQVAAQAVSIATGMAASLARAGTARIIRVPYDALARSPRETIGGIIGRALGAAAASGDILARLPERLAGTDTVRLAPDTAEALRRHVAEQMDRYR